MNNYYFYQFAKIVSYINDHFIIIAVTLAAIFLVFVILKKLAVIEKLIIYKLHSCTFLVMIVILCYAYFILEISLYASTMKSIFWGMITSIILLFIEFFRPNKPIVRFGKLR
jgi:hypothetical protein